MQDRRMDRQNLFFSLIIFPDSDSAILLWIVEWGIIMLIDIMDYTLIIMYMHYMHLDVDLELQKFPFVLTVFRLLGLQGFGST